MPRKPTGQTIEENGVYYARITLPDGKRPRYKLGKVSEMTRARAEELAAAMSERVREGGHVHVDKAGRGHPAKGPAVVTVEAFGRAWASGNLYEQHGAANKLKAGTLDASQRSRLTRHVYPVLGPTPVHAVTEQDIERTLARAPAGLRTHVYELLSRFFDLAIMPGRLRKDSPVTKYHRPPRSAPKLFPYIFPDELLAVLGCSAVPLGRRVLYALAVYIGLRRSSLYALRWSGFDEQHRAILSKISKTGIAQYIALDAGLTWVLARWREHLGAGVDARIVQRTKLPNGDLSGTLRGDLRLAGVTRGALFEHGGAVHRLRFHDLRATFATWAKRAGWTEGQITDRTGHVSKAVLERYMRAARTLADLQIDPFPPLAGAVPELAEKADEKAAPPGSSAKTREDDGGRTPEPIGTIRGNSGDSSKPGPPLTGANPAICRLPAESTPARLGTLRRLAETLQSAIEEGDLDAARSLHRALGEILG